MALGATVLAGGGLVAAGCGGDSGTAASSTAAAATASTTDNGVASLSAHEILGKAIAAEKAATSVRMKGEVPQGTGVLAIDLALGSGQANGQMTIDDVPVSIMATGGNTYIKAPAALFDKMGGDAGKVAGQVLGDQWFEVPTSGGLANSFRGLGNITDKDTLFGQLASSGSVASVKGTGQVNGQPVVLLTGPKKGTLAVATTGQPYPVQIKAASGSPGQIDFTDWNQPVGATVPANLVDLSALQKLANGG